MRLAFIGGWGHHYLRGWLADADTPFAGKIAVAGDGHDNPAAQALAAKLKSAAWYDDPAALLDEFQPQIVSVGAVYGYNADIIALALERHIPTVSDKPIAANQRQFDRIAQLAWRPRQILLTEFDLRAQPAFLAARQAVTAGHIGQPILAIAQKSYRFGTRPAWYADRQAYSGTMLWIASHGIDAIRFVTGRRLVRVFGRQGNLSQPDYGSMEDHTAAIFELDNGGTGIVHADLLRPAQAPTHGDDRLRVAGDRGSLEIRDGRCWVTRHDQPPTDITDQAPNRPVHAHLLAAVTAKCDDLYSTAWSLELARIMLTARDAADRQCLLDIAQD